MTEDWYRHDRFGTFVHWGLYSLGAREEWMQHYERLDADAYAERYFTRWDPDLYDPERWADAAADAGMRYVVITAKHHEGFCLWDSALTDFKAPNTPAKRDLLGPALEAFRSRGIRTGLYYSLIDWHHPDFMVDMFHPLRSDPDALAANADRDWDTYRAYLHGQVRELLSDYGRIDLLFADFSYDVDVDHGPDSFDRIRGKNRFDWHSDELVAMVRELQPGILVNDRMGLPDGFDITTPEQSVPATWPERNGERVRWEVCDTIGRGWGYHRDDPGYKTAAQLVTLLVDVVSKGGNLLLNVGPTARGELDPTSTTRLVEIGDWMARHARSIYGCTQVPDDLFEVLPTGVRATWNPETRRVYLHLSEWPPHALRIRGWQGTVGYAQLLHDASEVFVDKPAFVDGPTEGELHLTLGVARPDVLLPVIELFLD
ncbi:MAG TPA: alpha-L-fucosidase [Acidimicrobiales bacterium]|nr:alpha-L-fucosidase [Acidimicrobiales bacterium]